MRAGDLGASVFDSALETVLGVRPTTRVRMSGKTDPQIVQEYLEQMGVEHTEERVEAILRGIEQELATASVEGALAAGGSALPGVGKLLEILAGDNRVLSTLVTGNVAPNAVLKVAAFGLDQWLDLSVGAYGSDDADRNRLVPIAVTRVASARGVQLDPVDVWVIGDTPRDFECARAAGSRCLLVGTGRYSADELAPLGADAVFADLSNVDAVVDLLTGDL